MTLATANRSLLFPSRATARQQVIFVLAADQLDLDLGVLGEPLPGTACQLALERGQFTAAGGHHIPSSGLLEKRQRLLADHATIDDPDPLGFAKLLLDLSDDGRDGLQVLSIARQGPMRQGKAIAGHYEGQNDLLAVATMVSRVSPAGQIVLASQALDVGAGQVVEQEVVIELEEGPQPVFEVLLDRRLSGQQAIQRAIEPVLGHGAVGNTEQLLQPGGGVPVFGQGKLAAGRAEAIDDLDS